jgi:hypothetical protein
VTIQGGETPVPTVVQELQAELRAVREQMVKLEQWVFMVDVAAGELEARFQKRIVS